MEAPMEAPNSTASVAHEAREGREHSRPVPGWSRPSPKVRWLLHHLSCQNDQVDGRVPQLACQASCTSTL